VRRLGAIAAIAGGLAVAAVGSDAGSQTGGLPISPPPQAQVHSRAIGKPWHGRLVGGVMLPSEGADFFTWDPVLKRSPNREWRRFGTDYLIRTLLRTLHRYRSEHPGAPRVGVGDLSRPRGGDFGEQFGGLGHASHQNGLDVDLYYPRLDRRERRPYRVRLIDRALAQSLVDAFVDARAQLIFVGPHTGLTGPRRRIQRLAHHDDHVHVRIKRRRLLWRDARPHSRAGAARPNEAL
jgi:murein endopeptidase